jgi:hypothetical protein
MRRLAEYIHSPYFNIPSSAIEIFDYLHKVYPDFGDKKTQPAVITKKTKGLQTAAKQAKAGTELIKAIDGFLIQEQWQKQPGKMVHLVYGLKDVHLYERSEDIYYQVLKTNEYLQDLDAFHTRYKLAEATVKCFKSKLKRNPTNDIGHVLSSLDEYYAITKLHYVCEAINRNKILGTITPLEDITHQLRVLAPYAHPGSPYVYVYVHVYAMITATTYEEGKRAHQVISDMAAAHKGKKLPGYIIDSIGFGINWCMEWNAKGYSEASHQYIWWIEFKIKNDILTENGMIQPITFRNVIINAVQGTKSPSWIEEFIASHAAFLPPDAASINVDFANALCAYRQGAYTYAMRLLQRIRASDEPIFNIIIRRWQFMCLYENDPTETNILLDFLLAFDKYMQRQPKALDNVKKMFGKFISYSIKLIKKEGDTKHQKTFTRLNQEPYFVGKDWLLIRFGQIKGSASASDTLPVVQSGITS